MARLPSENELVSFLLRFIQTQKKRDRFEVLTGYEEDFRLTIGIATRVRRLVEAYFKLSKAGFSAEGEMLVRAAVEHAVSAQWAYLIQGGMDALRNSSDKSQASILKALYEGTSDPEVKLRYETAEESLPDGPFLPSFSRKGGILEELDVSFLNLSYRVLSQRVHVTSKTMTDAFAVSADGNALEVVDEPEGENHYEALTCLVASALLISWVLARLLGEEAEILRLQSFASQFGLAYRLDLHLPPGRRRFFSEAD